MAATTTRDRERAMERNVRLYPWYAALQNAHFWLPVFFLYFSEHLSLAAILRLEAIYYAAVVILEVPSGYFSDAVGRRPTLLIGAVATTLAHGLFLIGGGIDSFAVFIAAQVCLAAGISFNSGTDTSFLYDSLVSIGRERTYGDQEAAATRAGFLTAAAAALLGGAVALVETSLAYAASLLVAAAMFVIVLRMTEPVVADAESQADLLGRAFLPYIGACMRALRQPVLLWLFAFAVAMTVLNHVPYEFYQPYLALLGEDATWLGGSTPIVAGLHAAGAMFVASWFAPLGIRLRNRIGVGRTLLLATVLQTVIIGCMALMLHWAVALLVLLRSVPRALMNPILHAAITPRLPQRRRATYLSIQSLAGRLAFSGFLLTLSLTAGNVAEWTSLSLLLKISGGVAVIALLLLAITHHFVASQAGSDKSGS